MRVPLAWLAEYVPLVLSSSELAHRLTMAGIETTYDPGASAGWHGVSVGRVVALEQHPNADRLRLATVDLGSEALTVVCGAPNIAEGQRVAFARVGAELTDAKTGERHALAAATIRGVVSQGMVCSERELGLSDEHEGILVLPADAPVGRPLADYLADGALEIEVTANRGDCLAVLGIARELAAITGQAMVEQDLAYGEGPEPVESILTVKIENPELCRRYTATVVRGVKVGPSPEWLQRRLDQAGVRPINNVVDVTNYVMLEYGQPLHAFDLKQVRGQTIVVREARLGERFTTLDGVEHELRPPMLLIADAERAVAVAGVMGGANSEIDDSTADILIESATFNAINTRRTAQALRMRTEASLRFEKGLNPELAERALRRATALMVTLAGGQPTKGIADAFPGAATTREIEVRRSRMGRLLGFGFPEATITRVLNALGFKTQAMDADRFRVTPPYWRTDVSIEEDVIEEVARIAGYDDVPVEPLAGRVPASIAQPSRNLKEKVRDLLVEAGLQETISYTLMSRRLLDQVAPLNAAEPLRVANPMSAEQEWLRTSLRASMLRIAATGLRQPPGTVRAFEVGRVYLPRVEDLPDERELAVGILAGPRGEGLWADGDAPLDFFDAKGVVEQMLTRLGVQPTFERAEDGLLHPGRTAAISVNGRVVGVVGELHPRAVSSFDLVEGTVALFELDLGALVAERPSVLYRYETFSRYPAAVRDLAFLVDAEVPAEALVGALQAEDLVKRVVVFDVYEGSGLPPGKKSLAVRLELQSNAGTLPAEAITRTMDSLARRATRATGATLRA